MWIQYFFVAGLSMLIVGCVGPTEEGLASIEDEVKSLDYTVLRPPSNLHPPGTILFVRSAAPFTAQVVCEAESVLGDGVKEVRDSPTVRSAWKRKANRTFSIDADYLEQIKANLGYEGLREVSLTLSDTKLGELTDATLRRYLDSGTLHTACSRSIDARLADGFPLTIVQSTLGADAVYRAKFSSALDAELKAEILADIAPQLQAKVESASDGTLRGDDLIWGVRDDLFLFSIVARTIQADAPEPAIVEGIGNGRQTTRLLPLQPLTVLEGAT